MTFTGRPLQSEEAQQAHIRSSARRTLRRTSPTVLCWVLYTSDAMLRRSNKKASRKT
jgi:hypothetical protein